MTNPETEGNERIADELVVVLPEKGGLRLGMKHDILHVLEAKDKEKIDYWKEAQAILDTKNTKIAELSAEVERLKQPTLYDGLCKAIIARILEAETDCEPEHDILLRLETIIRKNAELQASIQKLKEESLSNYEFWTGLKWIDLSIWTSTLRKKTK